MNPRDRLLLATARAYLQAMGFPDDAKPEDYARHLEHLSEADVRLVQAPDIEITIPIRLHDALQLAKSAKDAPYWKAQAETEHHNWLQWVRAWRAALAALTSDPALTWKSRASSALRAMGLLGRTKRTKEHPELLRRWSTLTDHHVGPPEGPRLSQRAALLLIATETGIDPETIKKRLQREGVKVSVRKF